MAPFYNCELNLPNEAFSFGSDEYLKVWVNLAECLMRTNQFEKAAEKYETVKKRIQAEVVFDKPIMLINTCNQLGNCYLRLNLDNKARENFEQSLLLIEKIDGTSEKIGNSVLSAIYLNLGAIASQQECPEEAILFYERCLEVRERERNLKDVELIKCYELLGLECLKAEAVESAIEWFQRACNTSKNEFGESFQLAMALLNLGEAYNRADLLQKGID